ncbi:MAG: hypothetical protein GEV11_15140 [Streptosporangiales bacterium]|nr:hypothetical protein [Streptosporangiales bacterium]
MRRELTVAGVVLAGVALAGVPVGIGWYLIAPRAAEMSGASGPVPVDPENPAYFAADGWFALLTGVVGLLTGILAYLWLARRYRGSGTYHGPAVMLAVACGALLAAFIALRTGRLADDLLGGGRVAASGGRADGLVEGALNLRTTAAIVLWPLTAVLELAMLEFFLPTTPVPASRWSLHSLLTRVAGPEPSAAPPRDPEPSAAPPRGPAALPPGRPEHEDGDTPPSR